MNSTLKALHDQMLEDKPDSAEHVEAECPFCTLQTSENNGGNMSDTFTKSEVEAQVALAVAAATEELSKSLEEFKASQTASEVEAKIAAAQAEADVKVADLQAQLDAAVIEAGEATKARTDLESFLTAAQADADAATAIAARKDERVKLVTEAASFPEEYVTANADRWAGMSDEDFEATLADYKAVAEKASASSKGGTLPDKTALHASRDDAGSKGSATSKVFDLIRSGVDPRELIR